MIKRLALALAILAADICGAQVVAIGDFLATESGQEIERSSDFREINRVVAWCRVYRCKGFRYSKQDRAAMRLMAKL